jgi:hypothetical protein
MLTPDGLEVYRYVLERAQALRERGWDHYGMSPLWEMARYDGSLRVGPEGGFKLNDHYKSRLARRMMAEHADLEGFFELRELRA